MLYKVRRQLVKKGIVLPTRPQADSLSAAEAAKLLRVDVSRVWRRERSLFGLEYEGSRRLPRFQRSPGSLIPAPPQVGAAMVVPQIDDEGIAVGKRIQ